VRTSIFIMVLMFFTLTGCSGGSDTQPPVTQDNDSSGVHENALSVTTVSGRA